MGLDNPIHIVFLVVILLLVFGAKRLPEIGRSLGTGMREFKQSVTGESQGHDQQRQTLPPVTPQAPVQTPLPAQTPPQAQTSPPAQDAFAQRDPASSEKR